MYIHNLCHLLVEQGLFLEFVFGTVLLISNKRPVSFFLFLLLLFHPDKSPFKMGLALFTLVA